MRKCVSRFIALLLAVVYAMEVMSSIAYACLPKDDSKSQEEMDHDVRYWQQGIVPYTGDEKIYNSDSSATIYSSSCSHFAMCYALVKMGYLNPAVDTPMTHIRKAREFSAYRTDWGYFEYGCVEEMYPGVVYHGVDYNVRGLSTEDAVSYIKGKMNEGYYVIADVSKTDGTGAHMIFFDGINEDGSLSIGDSARRCLTWEEYYGTSDRVGVFYLELLKCVDKPFAEQPSIYASNTLRGVSSSEVTEFNTLIKEKELTGMPQTSNLSSFARLPSIADRSDLSLSEVGTIDAIKGHKDADKTTLADVARWISSFAGIMVLCYAALLLLAFLFDMVNSFIDISLVSLLTFGSIKVVVDKNDLTPEAKKQGHASIGKLFVIIAICVLIGVTLVSGLLLRLLGSIPILI